MRPPVSVNPDLVANLLREAHPPLDIRNLDLVSIRAEILSQAVHSLESSGTLREITLPFYGELARTADGVPIDFANAVMYTPEDPDDWGDGEGAGSGYDLFSAEETEGVWE